MSNEYAYEENTDWRQQEESEQAQWEAENDVASLLDNDPDYHVWSDNLDAEYIAHIEQMAQIELERNGGGITLEAWDR